MARNLSFITLFVVVLLASLAMEAGPARTSTSHSLSDDGDKTGTNDRRFLRKKNKSNVNKENAHVAAG